jgi:HK97 family phage prohead protease
VEEDGSFAGYASLFGEVDLGKDMVERGAFARSLTMRKASGIRMLFQHDPGEPIGAWVDIKEDRRGLFVRGRLAKGVARAREVLSLMRAGALDGLSIGFKTVRARRDPASGVRRILEADLWEISVVTFPMLPGARIETVKGGRTVSSGRRQAAPGSPRALAEHIREITRIINKRGKSI